MKIALISILSLTLTISFFPQNQWNLVWKMNQMPFQPPQTGSEMAIVKTGFDTDQDGWGEFLCAYTDLGENYLLMYEANANNSYDTVWYFRYPLSANSFAGIAVGDIDNNNKVDIITTMPTVVNAANPSPPRLWVFEWSGVIGQNKYGNYTSGTLQPTNEWNFELPNNIDFRPYSLTIEDIDNDSFNELIVGVRMGGRGREVLVASVAGELGGFGSWVIEYNLQGLTGGSLFNVSTGDLDNDNKKEIYAFIWNRFTMYFIECAGPNQYALVDSLKQITTNDQGALDAVRVADVNNDGVKEMYIAGTEPNNALFIITNITDVSNISPSDVKEFFHFPINGNPAIGATGKLRSMWIADPDKDGKKSLMIGGELNGQIFDFEYNGTGLPSDSTSWNHQVAFDIFTYSSLPPSAFTEMPRLFYGYPAKDMDKDGLDEYAFVNYHTNFGVMPNDAYVWILESQSQTGIENELVKSPNGFVLKQNFPNPFNPYTIIQYAVSSPQFVILKVYDILGNEVATLVNEEKRAGVYDVEFKPVTNTQQPASSIFFYRLQAGNYSETKKMILMK